MNPRSLPPPPPARSLASPATLAGVGLFTPAHAAVTIRPAAPGFGILFQRTDLPHHPNFPARADRTVARDRQTVLGSDPDPAAPSVQTVEHLLAAAHALGLTDLLVEVHGPEVPVLDGSALEFTRAMLAAGIVTHAAPAKGPAPAVVTSPITFEHGQSSITALPLEPNTPGPAPRLEVEYRLDYPGYPSLAGASMFSLAYAAPDPDAWLAAIAPARTFCTDQEALAFQARGLFRHLPPGCVLVMAPDGPAAPPAPSPRFPDEPARHKVLDVLGDLALAARPIHARILAHRSGHALNRRLAAALASL